MKNVNLDALRKEISIDISTAKNIIQQNTTKIQPKILHHCEYGEKYTHRVFVFSKIVSTTSQVTSYNPLYCINVLFLYQKC